jgi:hypothetical protein
MLSDARRGAEALRGLLVQSSVHVAAGANKKGETGRGKGRTVVSGGDTFMG